MVSNQKEETFPQGKPRPRCAVAIVTWNNAGEIRECLDGLEKLPENWEVWVVDNNSADSTASIVAAEFPFVNLIENADNKGFAEACNQVVAHTDTEFVLFLNPDTTAAPTSLVRALGIADSDPKIGVLGVRMINPDGSLQTTCFHFPTFWKNTIDSLGLHRFFSPERLTEMFAGDLFGHDAERNVDWLKGAFLLVRRRAMDVAGTFPEDYFMFAEDLDLCWQISRKGFDIRFTPEVSIVHASNKSAGQLPSSWRVERTMLSKYLFCFKNFGWTTARFVQLGDLLGYLFRMARRRKAGASVAELTELRMYRNEVWRSLFMSRRRIASVLQRR